jgi:acetyl-CoA acetyltransferase
MDASSHFRDQTAITGIGCTAFAKRSGRSSQALATEACLAAIDDAGLEPRDIDGLIGYFWCYRDPPSPHQLADALGLESCNLALYDCQGGGWSCSGVAVAAMAVHAGIASHVLVYKGWNGRSDPVMFGGGARADYWPTGARQWNEPFGANHAAALLGPYVSAYLHQFGLTNRDLADLAVLQRKHALLNRKAMMTKPITVEEHQASPWIVEPFRFLDCSVTTDGGMAVLVSRSSDARHMRRSPVLIRAASAGSLGPPSPRLSRNLWNMNVSQSAGRLYAQAGMTVADLDLAELYDPFTGVCLLHIEGYGLAAHGQAPQAIRAGEFGLDGHIPLNTHGGHLSEAGMAGLGHIFEAVQQLRAAGVRDDFCTAAHDHNRAHCRQVHTPETALVCGEAGDSALILRRAA